MILVCVSYCTGISVTSENSHGMSLAHLKPVAELLVGLTRAGIWSRAVPVEISFLYLLYLLLSVRNTSACKPYNNLPFFFPPE